MVEITTLSLLGPNGLDSYTDYLLWKPEKIIELIRGLAAENVGAWQVTSAHFQGA